MWGDQASASKYQTEFYYLNALITLQLFRKAVKHTQRKCSVAVSPEEQRPAWKQGWGVGAPCAIASNGCQMQKVSGEAPLLWASLVRPFILFSTGGKKNSSTLKVKSSRTHTSLLQQKKTSAHFRCHFQSPSFHLSQTFPPTVVCSFLFFFFEHFLHNDALPVKVREKCMRRGGWE